MRTRSGFRVMAVIIALAFVVVPTQEVSFAAGISPMADEGDPANGATFVATYSATPTEETDAPDDTSTFWAFLPAILRSPPRPSAPVLDEIDNPDGDGNYTVTWSAVGGATSYTLQEDDSATFSSPALAYLGAGTSESFTDRDPGTYYYRVKASSQSVDSDWSEVKSVTVQPTGPGRARLHLCCGGAIDEDCIIGGRWCWGHSWLHPDGEASNLTWSSGALLVDIVGTTYELGIAAGSDGSTTFEVQLFLVQEGGELLLASTTFTASSSEPTLYTDVVSGIDPEVQIEQDELKMRITYVSGDVGQIHYGEPAQAEAGGSYFEFPVNRAANGASIVTMGLCPLPAETPLASPAGMTPE